MQLSETGNLVLVDVRNVTLWESFDYPTDTIVMGQHILKTFEKLCLTVRERGFFVFTYIEKCYKMLTMQISILGMYKSKGGDHVCH